jgi:hypothetical protein
MCLILFGWYIKTCKLVFAQIPIWLKKLSLEQIGCSNFMATGRTVCTVTYYLLVSGKIHFQVECMICVDDSC